MITLIEASGYRCLHSIRQPLGPFEVLVGPNASGKTTFLDVIAFLGDLLELGLDEAVVRRTTSFRDMVWRREKSRFELEADLEAQLQRNGWGDRAAAIIIEPELEQWVWSSSPHVAEALGWSARRRELDQLLIEHDLMPSPAGKPSRPKEAVELALWKARKPRSSAIYKRIAEHASLGKCQDRAFGRLVLVLRSWFGEPGITVSDQGD